MKPKANGRGKCVYTKAELVGTTVAPDQRLDTPFYLSDLDVHCTPSCYWGTQEALIVRQRGNGSVRLVYPLTHGRGSWKPFVFPGPYKPCKHYPLDSNGVDPRDKEATEASRRFYGV